MVGNEYWTTGVILEWHQYANQWKATVEFYDSGFCDEQSTEGEIHTRYYCNDINDAIRIVMQDAKKLGIVFNDPPQLYFAGDGEWEENPPPPNWRRLIFETASKHGLESAYDLDLQAALDAAKWATKRTRSLQPPRQHCIKSWPMRLF